MYSLYETSLCHKNMYVLAMHDLATFMVSKMHLLHDDRERERKSFCLSHHYTELNERRKKVHCRKLDLLTSNCTHDRRLLQHTYKVISGS